MYMSVFHDTTISTRICEKVKTNYLLKGNLLTDENGPKKTFALCIFVVF